LTSTLPDPTPHGDNLPTSPLSSINLDEELDSAILSFEDIQAELNYKQAQTALRDLVANLDLTPQERTGLEAEIEQLETMLENLEHRVVQIAVFGMVGRVSLPLLMPCWGKRVCNRSTTRRYSHFTSQLEH